MLPGPLGVIAISETHNWISVILVVFIPIIAVAGARIPRWMRVVSGRRLRLGSCDAVRNVQRWRVDCAFSEPAEIRPPGSCASSINAMLVAVNQTRSTRSWLNPLKELSLFKSPGASPKAVDVIVV